MQDSFLLIFEGDKLLKIKFRGMTIECGFDLLLLQALLPSQASDLQVERSSEHRSLYSFPTQHHWDNYWKTITIATKLNLAVGKRGILPLLKGPEQ